MRTYSYDFCRIVMGDVERCRIRHFVWQQPSLPSAEHAGSSSALPSQLRELAKANRLIRRKLMDGCTCRLSRRLRTHRRRARTHQLTYRNSDNARRHHRLRVGCEVRAGGEDVARCCEQVSAAKTAPPKMTVVKGSDSSEQDAVQNKEGAKDRPADVTTTDGENNTTSTADDISAAGPEASATPTGTTTKDDTKTSDSTVAEDKKSDDNDAKADAAGDKRRPVNDKKQSGTTRSTRKPTPAPMRSTRSSTRSPRS